MKTIINICVLLGFVFSAAVAGKDMDRSDSKRFCNSYIRLDALEIIK